jgi:hypothetical protein
MPDTMTTRPDAPAANLGEAPRTAAEAARRTPVAIQGARWLWWIAGLTLVNAAMLASHAGVAFSLGLAFTQLGHAVFQANVGVAYAIDAFFVAAFFLLGQQAQRGQPWAFVLGAGLYLCDGLVSLKFGAVLPTVFHGVALFFIVRGYQALGAALKAAGLR